MPSARHDREAITECGWGPVNIHQTR
ncbi:hypothetical protein FAIPA1_220045 [Frankia sp. AiPs1]